VEQTPFFVFLRLSSRAKKIEKQLVKNIGVQPVFGDFGSSRRRFIAIFGNKTDPRRLLSRCFFENGDLVKIVLLL